MTEPIKTQEVPDSFAHRIPLWYLVGIFAAGMIGISLLLFPKWIADADLSHGFFMPVISLALIWEARRKGPKSYCSAGLPLRACTLAACIGGTVSLVFACLYALAFSSSHTLVQVFGTGSFALFGSAILLTVGSERIRLVPCNWMAWSAIWLWLFCAPIPPGAYSRLTITLQLAITKGVLFCLHIFGIPATRHGNVIELVNASVGVEDACSGVRSLISCIFAGLFFSAFLLRRPLHRWVLVVAAAALALAMNLLRSLTLTLLTQTGINVAGAWHDWTGHSILFFTAIMLWLFANKLDSRAKHPSAPDSAILQFSAPFSIAPVWRLNAFFSAVGIACLVFALVEPSSAIREQKTVPDLASIVPTHFDGWEQVITDDLRPFHSTLGTTTLLQRHFVRNSPTGREQITVYIAYWFAGQSNPSLVALHTPDGCWPAAGWKRLPSPYKSIVLHTPIRSLPEAEYRLFQSENGQKQHVWYWHMYRGMPIQQLDPYKVSQLLQMVLRFGFQPPSDQLFFRISSNKEWKDIAGEPLVQELLLRFRQFGL